MGPVLLIRAAGKPGVDNSYPQPEGYSYVNLVMPMTVGSPRMPMAATRRDSIDFSGKWGTPGR
jgi:hypothetical protein